MTELYEVFRAYNQSLCKNLPPQTEFESISFSKKFQKNARLIVRHYGKFYYSLIKTVSRRIVLTILVVIAVVTFLILWQKSEYKKNTVDVPDGYKEISQSENQDETVYTYSGKGGSVTVTQRYNQDGKIILDTDYLFFEQISLRKQKGLYFERAYHKGIRVIRGEYTYIITAALDFDKNELISIAESIK